MLDNSTTVGGGASTSLHLNANEKAGCQAPAHNRTRRVGDFVSAGRTLLADFKEATCTRLLAKYPGAPEGILVSAAEGAVRVARRYDDCRSLTDDVLDQAIRTTIRHAVLGYDSTLCVLGGRLDQDTHKRVQVAFWRIADLVADEFAKPSGATAVTRKPNRRRVWPPQVGGSK